MAATIHIDGFAERLKQLCLDYYETMMDDPPIVTNTMERMNSLIAGTRNPTKEEARAKAEQEKDYALYYLILELDKLEWIDDARAGECLVARWPFVKEELKSQMTDGQRSGQGGKTAI